MTQNNQEQTTDNWLKEAQKGYIRVAVLMILNKKPTHGYEIMKEIKDKTKGFYKPTAGGVYPILSSLEEAEFIQGEWQIQKNRKIKVYKITQKGTQILKNAIIKQTEIANNINALFREFAKDVLNIESAILPTPMMHNPFLAFLEEDQQPQENKEKLIQKQKHINQIIEMLQKELKTINKKLKETNQKT
jgi:DNA-binding PadR family transcriptional regulator